MGVAYFSLLFLTLFSLVHSINGKCLHDQLSHLLRLRDGFSFHPVLNFSSQEFSFQNENWNQTVDCCEWGGVECDVLGRVVSLELIGLIGLNKMVSIRNENWKALFSLQHLEKLSLSGNDFGVPIPMEIFNLTKLRYLDLSGSFSGPIPIGWSKLNNLVALNLSALPVWCNAVTYEICILRSRALMRESWWTYLLRVSNRGGLKALFQNLTELREVNLNMVNISAGGSDWFSAFSHMSKLQVLRLRGCELSGPIFPSLSNLSSVSILRLDHNPLSTTVPNFFANLTSLRILHLSNCDLHGQFPQGIFQIATLESLDVSQNELLEGSFPGSISNLGALSVLDLDSCNFTGPIPATMANLSQLVELTLSNNQFTGPIPAFQKSPNLDVIDLSGNSLTGKVSSSLFSLPALRSLRISNNKLDGWMEEFPNASSSSLKLDEIYLSLNVIAGEIPNWLWNPNLRRLDLSSNLLTGIQKPRTLPDSIDVLYLHSNMFEGEIPLLPATAKYVDYSNNNLSTLIPSNTSYGSKFQVEFFSLSNNNISGGIPKSLCNLTFLSVLDFSNNFLRGVIPECLCTIKGVLNLSGNKLSGHIPDEFRDNCYLRTLDLSQNAFNGKMPLSLVNCKSLQVVNVGNNHLEDHFPCKLIEDQSLRVVVLRSNKFHGEITCHWNKKGWTNLQILDVSYNNFTGTLPSQFFLNCRGMMVDDNSSSSVLRFDDIGYYKNTVNLVIKGNDVTVESILTIFKTLDFSCNGFQGKIPKEIGRLRGLISLNLSYNALAGTIPTSVGNLVELQSLDLKSNQLAGRIPSELGNLTYLAVLNLSYNQLMGKIPNGRQLQTFSETSFLGNKGLCGFPLSSCDHGSNFNGSSSQAGLPDKKEIDWEYVCAAVGFSVGLGIILLLNFLNPEWWQMFNALIIRFLISRIFCVPLQERRYRNPIPRL